MEEVKLNVKVTHLREYKIRMWVAFRLIRFALWITGIGIEYEHSPDDIQAGRDSLLEME